MTLTAEEELDGLVALETQVKAAIAVALTIPALAAARAACNEVGLRHHQSSLLACHDEMAAVLAEKRAADAALTEARKVHADAVAEAEWLLGGEWPDGRFKTEGNKTYLMPEPGPDVDLNEKRQMTADERRSWLAREATKAPFVAVVASALRAMEERSGAARDAVTLAEMAFSTRKHLLDAAVAELAALATALPVKENR